jgi:hypothetical protein
VARTALCGAHGDVGVAAGEAGQFVAGVQLVAQQGVHGAQALQGGCHQAVQHGVGGGDAHGARHLRRRRRHGRPGGFEGGLHALGVFGQFGGQLGGQVARARSLEQQAAQAALDALQRTEHRGGVHTQAFAGAGQRAAAHQGERQLQVAGGHLVLRVCNHGLPRRIFRFRTRNHRVAPFASPGARS